MKFIDKVFKMTEEAVSDLLWPLRRNAISRAFDSVAESTEAARIKLEQDILTKQKELTKLTDEGEMRKKVKEIIELRLDFAETEKIANMAKQEKEKTYSEE